MSDKSILVICPFPEDIAPAQRLKYEQYFDHWRAAGYRVDVEPFMERPLYDVLWKKGHLATKALGTMRGYERRLELLPRIADYDLVYLFLWATPFADRWLERQIRKRARRLIYDIDDNVHFGQALDNEINPNPIVRFLKGKEKYVELMREADHVIASSPYLEEEAKRFNKHGAATYITSSVDTDHFHPVPKPDYPKPVVGWTGTFSSQPFIEMIAPALRELSKERDFEFRVVGNFDFQMEGVDLKVVQFDRATEIEDLSYFDIGVYPLPNDDWVLGKSGLKAIVYMAMGLPVVASDVGTTPLLYEHGDIGIMVDESMEEWRVALRDLINDAARRKRQGAVAREVAVANYSRDAVAKQYLSIIDDLTKG